MSRVRYAHRRWCQGARSAPYILLLLTALPIQAAPLRITPAYGVGVESAALLMSGQQGGEIPFNALALPIPGGDKDGDNNGENKGDNKVHMLVRLRMDGPALLEGQTRDLLRIEASLYALGTGGGVLGSVLEIIEIDLASQRSAVESGGVDLLAGLDLKPGAYTLRLLARNLDTGHLGVRSLPLPVPELVSLDDVSLLSPPPADGDPRPTARSASLGPLDPPPFPTDPIQTASAGPSVPSAPAPAPLPVIPDTAEGRQLRSTVRSAYREALGRLAAGREADALVAVAALEDSLLTRKKAVTLEQLVEIETGAALELAVADPAVLAPLLRLHQRLYEEAHIKRRHRGSTLAREIAGRLTDFCRERGQADLAHRFSAVFGIQLVRGGVTIQGGQMLQGVLAQDPEDEAILLEKASSAERHSASAEAAEHLEAVLRAHPENREARLRLALAQARMGKTNEAQTGLRAILQEETGGWRLSLAYQELARLQMTQGSYGAMRTLREGLDRLPGDEKLTLMLAALLDRSGQGAEARLLLARLKPQEGEDGGGAARRRYSRPPEEPFTTRHQELGREAAANLPALAAALEKTAP